MGVIRVHIWLWFITRRTFYISLFSVFLNISCREFEIPESFAINDPIDEEQLFVAKDASGSQLLNIGGYTYLKMCHSNMNLIDGVSPAMCHV